MRIGEQARDGESLPLVMLPGTLCDGRIFQPLQQRLASTPTQVIVTRHACSLEQAADEVLAQMPERFMLLGFSLGGMVAMETALRAPERVRALVLISTTPLPVPPERHAGRRALVEEARTQPMRRFIRERLWAEYGGAPNDARTLPLIEQMADELGAKTFAAQTEMALRRCSFFPRLNAITCPTLIVGGMDDLLCPPGVHAQLAEAVSTSTCVILPGAGHFALFEQPDEVATPVAAWLHTLKQQRAAAAHARSNREDE